MKKNKKSYAVFGLGKYGIAVAKELAENGADVIAVDMSEANVNQLADIIPVCKCADITDPAVIKQLGIANMDTVIISMARNLEASVLAVMLCKEAGVPTVIAKCANEMHYKILMRVGADKVVFPEIESGARLAKNILSSGFIDVMDLSDEMSIVEMDIKPEWIGKTLVELNLRKKYSINIVAIRVGEELSINIDPQMQLNEKMTFVVIGSKESFEMIDRS